ncbi:unnamed protein product [Echinostoma caproni]|uniref:SH2 domain-containing protein n=1 Tax=Echinostoma caproni TaxID=27848 RepID=A0A183AVE1_9TREM|nr:unnamed protein product [Echinostoma caproni]
MAFLRRHFLRRSEGKRLSAVADAQQIGGSTRQPRRRPGAGLSGLFSQARHSAFFPSTTTTTTVTISDVKETDEVHRDQSDTSSTDWLGRISSTTPQQKPHIFVDLRTFAGGSPVVALKEILDAQAVADAKASAFAEAAAVLAAAKLASESSNSSAPSCVSGSANASATSCSKPRTSASNSRDHFPISSSATTIANSAISSDGNGGSGNGSRQQSRVNISTDEPESAPVPPVRLHSLGRGPQRPLPQTPGGDGVTGGQVCAPKPVIVRGGFRADKNTACLSEEDVTGVAHDLPISTSESTASSPGGRVLTNGHGQDHSVAPCLPARSGTTSFFAGWSKSAGMIQQPMSTFAEFPRTGPDCMLSQPTPAPVMSASTISAETPTPTATPTPTPSQTPQPFGNQVLISREDCEFLRHAPWYQALLPRELAFELLAKEEIGSFLVRNSATHPDCCALSVRVPAQNNPTGITHYLIQRTENGFRLKGLDKEWPSLRALITHLTVIPEMLPCLLRMPAHSTNPVFTQLDEPRGEFEPGHTVQRGSEHGTRSHRITTGPINLQAVTSLPSRPVPPTHIHSCGGDDNGEALCRYDEATLIEGAKSRNGTCNNDVDNAFSADIWTRPAASSSFEDDGDEAEDEDYQRLSDFSSMMADLKPASDTQVTSC